MPISQKLLVQCKSLLEGEEAEGKCSVACTGCSRCVADSAPEVISIENNLAVINYSLNDLANPYAIKRCPTGAIVWLESDNQFELVQELDLPLGRVEEGVYYQ